MRLCLGLLNIMDFMVMGGECYLLVILLSVLSLSVTVSTAQGMAFTHSLIFAQCQSLSCSTLIGFSPTLDAPSSLTFSSGCHLQSATIISVLVYGAFPCFSEYT